MKPEEKIISMCLFGLICRESKTEQDRCLEVIQAKFGSRIASLVEGYIRK